MIKSPSSLLMVRDLTLGYGRADVVSNINIDVAEGAIVALIGSNGAGKTTTLRGISGLLKARKGSVTFDAREFANVPAYRVARAGIVHVPEGRQIFPNMTVEENLFVGGINLATSRRQELMAEVLRRFPRLSERMPQLAGLMSGGEQQMLAIGRALMADPRLLILDEPSMGLAPMIVADIFETIEDLRKTGRTILLVEQNARAALRIADYAYVLESGRIHVEGPAAQIANNPEVIAAYLGG
jgi:branched-chain amino acid transport system ATP-binding protein